MSDIRTPLDPWIASLAGEPDHEPLRSEALERYQVNALKEALRHARANSRFHDQRLNGISDLSSLSDMSGLPFTTQDDLREHGRSMLCISQDQVARIMTFLSSGTTGAPKRIFFSDRDLERTMDFFDHGMRTMAGPGDKVLIFLPQNAQGTGDLLSTALGRFRAIGFVAGLVNDTATALDTATEINADCLVGFPAQLLALARLCAARKGADTWPGPKSVLLCSDYVPDSIVDYLRRTWDCRVFSHWGTSETGLGGAVTCRAGAGLHLRAADLIMEIIDPATLSPLPPGEWGEMVVTTLHREAMPLIRLRTGDMGRIIPGPCPCGSVVPRLDKVRGRISGQLRLVNGRDLELRHLDEALFALNGVMDFEASLGNEGPGGALNIRLVTLPGFERDARNQAREALSGLARLLNTEHGPGPGIAITASRWTGAPLTLGKRKLKDERS